MQLACRGFTTLSTTLGHLVIALHDGLLHAVSSEAVTAPLINILKALQTLMASAAYSRLPTNLLPRCIEVSLMCPTRLSTACSGASSYTVLHSTGGLHASCTGPACRIVLCIRYQLEQQIQSVLHGSMRSTCCMDPTSSACCLALHAHL